MLHASSLAGAAGAAARDQFFREAQLLCRLRFAHVVRVFGVVIEPPAIVMEYFPRTLSRVLTDHGGPLPLDEALRIAAEVALGIRYLHMQVCCVCARVAVVVSVGCGSFVLPCASCAGVHLSICIGMRCGSGRRLFTATSSPRTYFWMSAAPCASPILACPASCMTQASWYSLAYRVCLQPCLLHWLCGDCAEGRRQACVSTHSCCLRYDFLQTACGTPHYMAPEVAMAEHYTTKGCRERQRDREKRQQDGERGQNRGGDGSKG